LPQAGGLKSPSVCWAQFDSRDSGYTLARMRFEIALAPEAVEDFKTLRANVRADIRSALETHLRHEPEKVSRSRIKRLRGLRQPQYRLRAGDVRIFYDVKGTTVQVLAIVTKLEADS
jgi:mRNA interferase RelE/StbE